MRGTTCLMSTGLLTLDSMEQYLREVCDRSHLWIQSFNTPSIPILLKLCAAQANVHADLS